MDRIDFTPPLKMHDWVLVKPYAITSRIVDIKSVEDGFFRYGVTDRLDDIHYFKISELVKLKEDI